MKKAALRRRIVLWGVALYFLFYLVLALRQAAQKDFGLLTTFGLTALFGFCVLSVVYSIKLKRLLVSVFSSMTHAPARADQFPDLDAPEFERLTAQWEELGFVRSGDFGWRSSVPSQGTSFSRVFEHPTEGAVVELLQQFTITKTLPVGSLVQSFWGEREEVEQLAQQRTLAASATAPLADPTSVASSKQQPISEDIQLWAQVTHNRQPNQFYLLFRHPRTLAARLDGNATPAQIWQLHQQRVALVEARLGAPPLRGNLSNLMYAHGQLFNTFFAQRISAIPPLTLVKYSLNRKPAPPFYDGELAPLAK